MLLLKTSPEKILLAETKDLTNTVPSGVFKMVKKKKRKEKPATQQQDNGYRRTYSQQKHHGHQTPRTYGDTHRMRLGRLSTRVCVRLSGHGGEKRQPTLKP